MVRTSRPLAASAPSRICSAASRYDGPRAKPLVGRVLLAARCGVGRRRLAVRRPTARSAAAAPSGSSPDSTNVTASQSSSSRVGRQLALVAEVLRRGDEPAAEEHRPVAVDDHPGVSGWSGPRASAPGPRRFCGRVGGKRRQARGRAGVDALGRARRRRRARARTSGGAPAARASPSLPAASQDVVFSFPRSACSSREQRRDDGATRTA